MKLKRYLWVGSSAAVMCGIFLITGCSDSDNDDSRNPHGDVNTHGDVFVPSGGLELTATSLDEALDWIDGQSNGSCIRKNNASANSSSIGAAHQEGAITLSKKIIGRYLEEAKTYKSRYLTSRGETAKSQNQEEVFGLPDKIDGDCGGELTVDGENSEGGGEVTINFDEFCVVPIENVGDSLGDFDIPIDPGDEVTVNGKAKLDVEDGDQGIRIEASIDSLSISSDGFSVQVELKDLLVNIDEDANKLEASLDNFEVRVDDDKFMLSFDSALFAAHDAPDASSSSFAQALSVIGSVATVSDPFLRVNNLALSVLDDGEGYGLRNLDISLHVEDSDKVYVGLDGMFFNPDGQLGFSTPDSPVDDRLRVDLEEGSEGLFGVLRLASGGNEVDIEFDAHEDDFEVVLKTNGNEHAVLDCSKLLESDLGL